MREYFVALIAQNKAEAVWPGFSTWPTRLIAGPQQDDGSSCGAFACTAMDILVRALCLLKGTRETPCLCACVSGKCM